MPNNTTSADAISTLPETPATVLLPVAVLETLLAEIRAQGERIDSLEALQREDSYRLALDIALDRQRLAKLERVEPQPRQKDRGEILRAILAANGGKMLAKECRQKMGLDKATFSRLIAQAEGIEVRPMKTDKRRYLLILKTGNG